MKTKEELSALKKEVEALKKKLAELNEDELKLVSGGAAPMLCKINPNEIEEIQILKDASATAVYGSRGGNGVILVP